MWVTPTIMTLVVLKISTKNVESFKPKKKEETGKNTFMFFETEKSCTRIIPNLFSFFSASIFFCSFFYCWNLFKFFLMLFFCLSKHLFFSNTALIVAWWPKRTKNTHKKKFLFDCQCFDFRLSTTVSIFFHSSYIIFFIVLQLAVKYEISWLPASYYLIFALYLQVINQTFIA